MKTTIESQIEKLPKWAQEHIKAITRERDYASKAMAKAIDGQTESPFSVMAYDSTSCKFLRWFVNTSDGTMEIRHGGVLLRVQLRNDNGRKTTDLSWSKELNLSADVAMIPTSYQQVKLATAENIRP